MNINDVLKSPYVKAYDLQGREPVVTIARVALVSMGWGAKQEQKAVCYFAGKDKGLVLNATMLRAIAAFAGEETDQWIGLAVQLFTTTAKDPKTGQQVPVVRVKAPSRQPVLVKAGGSR